MMQMATWNVNSLKVRIEQVVQWLTWRSGIDVLALQETKLEDKNFPLHILNGIQLNAVFSGQKSYNGVALLSRYPLTDIQINIPGFIDAQKRLIAATCQGIRIICIYAPNGQAIDSEKYQYKLAWFTALISWIKKELNNYPKLVILGDYNIAPSDEDVHDPQKWTGRVLVSLQERALFQDLLTLGFQDTFRLFEQPDKCFSWWDYRENAFKRNAGLRIDHILFSSDLAQHCMGCEIDKTPRFQQRPSDHTPVIARLAF